MVRTLHNRAIEPFRPTNDKTQRSWCLDPLFHRTGEGHAVIGAAA